MTAAALNLGRPLLKWAGGKRQLLPTLRRYYPREFGRYLEPFVGSGAVFFDLYASGRLRGRRVRLADVSPDLIGCYRSVRDNPEAVISRLAELEEEHGARGDACYYDVRDRRFNPARAALGDRAASAYTPSLAAMLIYLNRTGYNGLFRLNRQGAFNVPAGRYTAPRICDPDHIRAVAGALATDGISLECMSFDAALSDVRAQDFVYCDPPYAARSRTSSFSQYTAGGFTASDHHRLRDVVVTAARRGAIVLLSNSSVPEIEAAYASPEVRRAGLVPRRVRARRVINSRAELRGEIRELIVATLTVGGPKLRMARARLRPSDPHQLPAARTRERQS